MTTTKRIQRKRLTQPEFYQLCRYLEDNKTEIRAMTSTQIIKQVQEALGLYIERKALDRAEEALGVDWIIGVRFMGDSEERDRILASAILALYQDLGIQAPEEIEELTQKPGERRAA